MLLGFLFLLAGGAAIAAGLFASPWLRAQLPAVTAEPEVVARTALTLGIGLGVLGAAHIGLAARLDRPPRAVRATAVVGALTLAMAAVTGVATVAVSLARDPSAAPLWPAIPGLGAVVVVYALLAVHLLRAAAR